ncbi:hypothetical protein NA56DRAFT_756067 [Hyaloscypha hepaticicola]|uniref:Uncharacterized protein n=1 Tax=Hyaloscypha hepaticicola TaxID=2082293 RepID=A0A2J6PGC2_9HELO|nr:hypothetical protein NA56DRAFT_756067 [Hyaloscypha hepaticicola]
MKFTYFVAIATMLFGMGMAVAIPSDEVAPIPDGESYFNISTSTNGYEGGSWIRMGFGDSLGLVFPDGFPYLRVNAKAENIGNNTAVYKPLSFAGQLTQIVFIMIHGMEEGYTT